MTRYCWLGRNQDTTKLTRKLTRHSVTLPSSSVTTLMSFTQAPLMFLTLLATFFKPPCTASSIPFLDDEEISMTLVTVAMTCSRCLRPDGLVDYTPGIASSGA